MGQGMVPCIWEARIMRLVLLSISAFAMSTPALAADKPSKMSREIAAVADTLNNPSTQRAIEGTLGSLMDALLDLRVDGFAKALEPLNKGKPLKMKGKTLREMAEREDRNFEEKLDKGTHMLVGGMGALSSALAQMAPQLEAAMEKMEDEIEKIDVKLPKTN